MLKLKHKSAVRSTNSGGASYRETYYGTRSEVETRSAELAIGDRDPSGEYELTAWRTRQIGGPIYEIELVWENLNAGSNLRFLIGRHGPKEHTLDISVVSVPLEDHQDYRTNWNYCLAAKGTEETPAWWESATDPVLNPTQRMNYRWVKTPSGTAALGEGWHLLKMRTMNCESWLLPSYTITEFSLPEKSFRAFTLANLRFAWNSCLEALDERRPSMVASGVALAILCQLFGWGGYQKGRLKP